MDPKQRGAKKVPRLSLHHKQCQRMQNRAELDALWHTLKVEVALKLRAPEELSREEGLKTAACVAEGKMHKPRGSTMSEGAVPFKSTTFSLKSRVLLKSRELEEHAKNDGAILAESEFHKPRGCTKVERAVAAASTTFGGSVAAAAASCRKRPCSALHSVDGAPTVAGASRKRPYAASDEPRKRTRVRAPTVSGPRARGASSKVPPRGEK